MEFNKIFFQKDFDLLRGLLIGTNGLKNTHTKY